MKLNENEFGIGTLHKDGVFKDAIIITKEALERLLDDYKRESNTYLKAGALELIDYTDGKADLLEDLLKLFEDEDKDSKEDTPSTPLG